jgi:predicted phosphoribosyltransferase
MFQNQTIAGQQLAQKLALFKGDSRAIIAAIPGGGIMTAYTVSKILGLPLELISKPGLGNQKSCSMLHQKTVILVDDGIQTGHTLSIAIQLIKKIDPESIIIAVPIAPEKVIHQLCSKADEVICLKHMPEGHFLKDHYQEFSAINYLSLTKLLREKVMELQINQKKIPTQAELLAN